MASKVVYCIQCGAKAINQWLGSKFFGGDGEFWSAVRLELSNIIWCRVEFSKPCEGILRDFWEEFSRKKLPARPVDIQEINLNKIDKKINS